MTCLVEGFRTKKDLIAAVRTGHDPYIIDPSIFAPYAGPATQYPGLSTSRGIPVCLDHPKRTKFALISLNIHGNLVVS